jgi:hypothetical protein
MVGVPGVFDISIGEVKEIIEGSLNYFRKDKISLCVHLDIINMSLLDWYNDIIDKFSHWQRAGMKVESSDLELIFRCTNDATRKSIAQQSVIMLKNVERLYKDDKLDKKLKRDLDIDKITKQAIPAIRDFSEQTYEGKAEWLWAARGGTFTKKHIEDTGIWLKKLREDVEVVNKSLSELRLAMKCEPTSEEQLRKYGRRK